jgi:hypothetical protein
MNDYLPAWELLRQGHTERGLDFLQATGRHDSDVTYSLQEGLALLWTGEYDAVRKKLTSVIRTLSNAPAELFGMIGVANWCLGDLDAAVESWSAGYRAPELEDRNGLRLPLLVLVAAILHPGLLPKGKAADVVEERLDPTRTGAWPAPLAKLLLATTSETRVDRLVVGAPDGPIAHQRRWAAEFYLSIRGFDANGLSDSDRSAAKGEELMSAMQHLADPSRLEMQDVAGFIALIRQEEFFLARHMANHPQSVLPRAPLGPWSMLRSQQYNEGLAILSERYRKDPSHSAALSLGAGYMWVADYESAWDHFRHAIAASRWTYDSYFGMSGAAKCA